MLVLTRKIGESIVIGDNITIKVSQVSGNRVKICVDAPRTTRVLREEVIESMTQTKSSTQPKAASDVMNKRSNSEVNICS